MNEGEESGVLCIYGSTSLDQKTIRPTEIWSTLKVQCSHYDECLILYIAMLNVVILSVVMLSVVMLSVIMLKSL